MEIPCTRCQVPRISNCPLIICCSAIRIPIRHVGLSGSFEGRRKHTRISLTLKSQTHPPTTPVLVLPPPRDLTASRTTSAYARSTLDIDAKIPLQESSSVSQASSATRLLSVFAVRSTAMMGSVDRVLLAKSSAVKFTQYQSAGRSKREGIFLTFIIVHRLQAISVS